DEVDQDRDLDLVAGGLGGDRVDLGVVAVDQGEPVAAGARGAAGGPREPRGGEPGGGGGGRGGQGGGLPRGGAGGPGAGGWRGWEVGNRASRMSDGVRGVGGMSATQTSSAQRFVDLRCWPGSSGQPSEAACRAAALAVAGRSAVGSTGNADPSAVISSPTR